MEDDKWPIFLINSKIVSIHPGRKKKSDIAPRALLACHAGDINISTR